MNPPASLERGDRGHRGLRWLRLLAVVFTIAALGSLVLVVTDLLIGRPPAGDLFIACLNALAAVVLRREVSKARGQN
ncbi:hypothetical protein EU811_20940 [Arthrobacter sp. TS-15]|uniref:hypothetical protein n=1 Tax=Arthrobacter sp. TS-15 TaxID=2510797 RepID=UPI00115F6FC1|nr:hypothetical protein [Arthrobacter sp. TS-15]TQS88612.1 hypothetical protein EU811_20940 [Arthrobacter sp. TS-15]